MTRIFVTGSSDGLGLRTAQALVKNGHQVVLHARNAQRAKDASAACPGAETVLVGDLSKLADTKKLAEDVNKIGPFDCVIHNAGLYRGSPNRNDVGIPALVAVNSFAPYVLTALITPMPKRLIYVSSGMHKHGPTDLSDMAWQKRSDREWNDGNAYSASKFHNILLTKAVARRFPDVQSNALDPGWVPTKMGGFGAPGDIEKSIKTYMLLATSDVKQSGKYFVDSQERPPRKETLSEAAQDEYMKQCEDITGIPFPK